MPVNDIKQNDLILALARLEHQPDVDDQVFHVEDIINLLGTNLSSHAVRQALKQADRDGWIKITQGQPGVTRAWSYALTTDGKNLAESLKESAAEENAVPGSLSARASRVFHGYLDKTPLGAPDHDLAARLWLHAGTVNAGGWIVASSVVCSVAKDDQARHKARHILRRMVGIGYLEWKNASSAAADHSDSANKHYVRRVRAPEWFATWKPTRDPAPDHVPPAPAPAPATPPALPLPAPVKVLDDLASLEAAARLLVLDPAVPDALAREYAARYFRARAGL